MKPSRLAAWIFVAGVCGAWLASAAGVSRSPRMAAPPARTPSDVRFDALAADVQAQSVRLRERLANAPAPVGAARNPFTFPARPAVVRRPAAAPAAVPEPVLPAPPAAEVREPALDLIGIAENRTANGITRTAMITGGFDELMMVTAGQRILGRYDVALVSVDAVELKDVQTGATRRLVLK